MATSNRPTSLTKFHSDNPELNRLQDHLSGVLNPILKNPPITDLLSDGVFASYHQTTSQSILAATNTTLNFDSRDADDLGTVTTGTGWKFVVPNGKAGLYQITAFCNMAGANSSAGGVFILEAFKNGSSIRRLVRTYVDLKVGLASVGGAGSVLAQLVDGDAVSIIAFQSTSATQSTEANESWVQISRVVGY